MRTPRLARLARALPPLALPLLACGCAVYRPVPIEDVPFLERAVSETQDEVTVTVAVLSAEESNQVYGRPLSQKAIQPVWFEIENRGEFPFVILYTSVDNEYFSPSEVAYIYKIFLAYKTNPRISEDYRDLALPTVVRAGETASGFVLTNASVGTKVVPLTIYRPGALRQFLFFVRVPGINPDHMSVDFESLYAEDEVRALKDEDEFRRILREFQCCTRNKKDTNDGDPLNLVLIGDSTDIFKSLALTGWHETETITLATAWNTFKAFLSGGEYKTSPVSAQYVFGRRQDIALQKARSSIHQRNHMRLWLAPWSFQGKDVWIGQISRDIGVRLTSRTWNLTTHAIDPEVDEARDYLLMSLISGGRLESWGFTEGVGEATRDDPRVILLGDPYWTDGHRAVFFFGSEERLTRDIQLLLWELPGGDEGQTVEERQREIERMIDEGADPVPGSVP